MTDNDVQDKFENPLGRHHHPRIGKTGRDKANNQHGRNRANKDARVAWQKDRNPKAEFPLGSCNGKKTRALRRFK